jgi:hypothetical protein
VSLLRVPPELLFETSLVGWFDAIGVLVESGGLFVEGQRLRKRFIVEQRHSLCGGMGPRLAQPKVRLQTAETGGCRTETKLHTDDGKITSDDTTGLETIQKRECFLDLGDPTGATRA